MHEKLKWTLICVLISNPNIELLLSGLHCTVGKFGNTLLHFIPQKQCSYTSLPDFYHGIIQVHEGVEFLVWSDMCGLSGCVFLELKEFGALKYMTLYGTWMIYW